MAEIFGTLGPACAQVDLLEKMFLEGMTGMRLNLSHSGLKASEPFIHSFHQAAQRAGVRPELLIDMQGPELRIGDLRTPLQLHMWEELILAQKEEANASVLQVPADILSALEVEDHILLDDGKMELVITSVQPRVTAKVCRGGVLQKRKSLKIVGKSVSRPASTEQDRENIRLAKDYGVTALMQPFVTNGAQLLEVRRELVQNRAGHIRIFAKIENCEGITNICDILPQADLIVIARGDLGNDMPLWKLPAAQKTLSDLCRKKKKPFLVVTELLASMVHNPYPTRAEVSDIFHAITDGASAIMATNETAVGKYPVEVIRYMAKTAHEAEKAVCLHSAHMAL